jgi:ribose-phosphate pyrophosphokinase
MIKVGNVEIKQDQFPDGTLLMKFDPNGDEFDLRGNILVEWYYENDAELFSLICVKRHLDRVYSYSDVVLYMPYIPHARMDRVKADEDVFTLKYFAEVINSLHFSIVWVRDAHSNVSLALIDNVCDTGVKVYIRKAIELSGANAMFYPDEGAMKRYSSESELPYAFGMKKRDWKTGKIEGLDIINTDNIVGKDVLIVDDICSRGGTFYHSAKALKAAGAKSVSLYVTHCEKTIVLGEMASTDGLVDHVYTTKSIFPDYLFEEGSYDPYWREWITVME